VRLLGGVEGASEGPNVAHRQTGSIETDDLVIHAIDQGLALLHQFRLETAVPVTLRKLAVLS